MARPSQIRERSQIRGTSDPQASASLLFSTARLLDVARQPAGVVDALRIPGKGLTFGRVVSVGHEIEIEDPDCITVLLPTRGRILLHAEGGDYAFSSGDLAIVEAEKRRTRVIAPKDGAFSATTVHVPRHLLTALDRDRKGAVPWGRGRSAWSISGRFAQTVSTRLPELADAVFRVPDRLPSTRTYRELVSLIEDLLVDTCCGGDFEAWSIGGLREFQRVSRACDIIRARSDEPLSITALAAELEVSPRYLQLSFRSALGLTPREYLQQVRLDRVRARLIVGRDRESITTLALECGFTHLGRFSQVYRRAFGELPSETAALSRTCGDARSRELQG